MSPPVQILGGRVPRPIGIDALRTTTLVERHWLYKSCMNMITPRTQESLARIILGNQDST